MPKHADRIKIIQPITLYLLGINNEFSISTLFYQM